MKEKEEKVSDLSKLVSYSEGSVVSKELIKKETGTVTLFSFDKGEGLSEHKAPYDALVLILDGKADVTISGKAYRLDKGQMIVMPANKMHSLKAIERFKMMLVMIKS